MNFFNERQNTNDGWPPTRRRKRSAAAAEAKPRLTKVTVLDARNLGNLSRLLLFSRHRRIPHDGAVPRVVSAEVDSGRRQ